MKLRTLAFTSSFAALTIANIASAQPSTETYTYDALGRLIKVETSGGQNSTEKRVICYDKAGNRTEYKAASGSTTPTCPPPPPSN